MAHLHNMTNMLEFSLSISFVSDIWFDVYCSHTKFISLHLHDFTFTTNINIQRNRTNLPAPAVASPSYCPIPKFWMHGSIWVPTPLVSCILYLLSESSTARISTAISIAAFSIVRLIHRLRRLTYSKVSKCINNYPSINLWRNYVYFIFYLILCFSTI